MSNQELIEVFRGSRVADVSDAMSKTKDSHEFISFTTRSVPHTPHS